MSNYILQSSNYISSLYYSHDWNNTTNVLRSITPVSKIKSFIGWVNSLILVTFLWGSFSLLSSPLFWWENSSRKKLSNWSHSRSSDSPRLLRTAVCALERHVQLAKKSQPTVSTAFVTGSNCKVSKDFTLRVNREYLKRTYYSQRKHKCTTETIFWLIKYFQSSSKKI